jgi:vacuolar-type H+-ATPase subunit H
MPAVNPESDTIAAINRVLDAERQVAEAVRAANAAAEKTLEAARSKRRQILERARRRAARMHAVTAARLDEMIGELQARVSTGDEADGASQPVLATATRRLAERLTRDDDERP